MDKFLVGIDPGWKNLGLAISKQDTETGKVTMVHTRVMNPASYSSPSKFINNLDLVITPLLLHTDHVTIERFVAYAGVDTAETENICMLIGSLTYYFASPQYWNTEPLLLRAIDWKTKLVKELYKKKGFDNPSAKLDKKFSIAAAHSCMDEPIELKTDHEADALCLSAFPIFTVKGT